MKLFVAAERQPGDTFDTIPGELVRFPLTICESLDCHCDQVMHGLVSHRPTPAVMVRELAIEAATFTELLGESLADEGREVEATWLEEYAATHLETAAFLPAEEPMMLCHFAPVDPQGCSPPSTG